MCYNPGTMHAFPSSSPPDSRLLPRRPSLSRPAEPPLRYGLLERILTDAAPFPNPTVVFGMDENGFPLILELSDPAAGAFALIGGRRSGLRNLMRAVLYSLVFLNPPEQAAFYALSPEPGWLEDFSGYAHCLGIERPYRRAADALLLHLVEVCEARRAGRRPGPRVLLLLDGLAGLLARCDGETRRDLRYLMRRGPAQGIWPMARLSAGETPSLGADWLPLMRTRILAHIADEALARRLDADGAPRASGLHPGREFGTRLRGRWLRFAIPAFYDHELYG